MDPQQQHHMSGYHPHLAGGGGPIPYGHHGHVPYPYHPHHPGAGPYGHPGYPQQLQQVGPHGGGGGGGGVPPLQAFFAPWEPPPPPVAAPQDVELQKRIAKLVEYAAKNGPQFEALMKEKQKENPAYAFLFGGEGHDFYRFRLWVTLSQHMQPGVPGAGGGGGGSEPHMAAAYGGHMAGGPAAGYHEHAQQQQEFYNQAMGVHPSAHHHQPHPQHMHPQVHPHPYDANFRRMDPQQQQQQQLAEQHHQQQVADHAYGQVHGGHPGYGQVPGGPHQHMGGQHYHMSAAGQQAGPGYHMENQLDGAGATALGPSRGGSGLPHELATELQSILDNLTGTKDSIKNAKTWFMTRVAYAEQLAEAMRDRVRQLDDPERQLHIVFLANDILFNSFNHRASQMELDGVALAFRSVLGSMLSMIYHSRQNTEANQERLQCLLHFWGKMEFYDRETILALEHEMVTGVPSVFSAPSGHPSSSYGMIPPHMGPGHGYYGTPHHMGWGSYVSRQHQQQAGSAVHHQQQKQQEDDQRRHEEQDDARDDDGDDGDHEQQTKRQKLQQEQDMEEDRRQGEEQSPPPGEGPPRSNQESASRVGDEHMDQKDHQDCYGDSPDDRSGTGKYYPPPGTVPVPYSSGVASTHGLHAQMSVGVGVGMSGFSMGMTATVAPNAPVSAPVVPVVPTSLSGVPGIAPIPVAVVPQSVTTGPGDKPLPFPLFPPGLIPGMVRKLQVGSGVPYSPLSPLDIPPVIPPPSVPESYILDRVRKYFKEVGEMDPLDANEPEKEATPDKEDREEDEEPEPGAGIIGGLGLGMMMVDPETGTLPDGSVEMRPGMVTSGKLGLGATADPNEITQYDDVYLSYRKQRSSNYHTSLGLRAGLR